MSRRFTIRDLAGSRHLGEDALPLSIGTRESDQVRIAEKDADAPLAYIAADADGHLYLQTAESGAEVFHNHVRLDGSVWLKSGDRIDSGDATVTWTVTGDQVVIDTRGEGRVVEKASTHAPTRKAVPQSPPPALDPSVLPPASAQTRTGWGKGALTAGLILVAAVVFLLLAAPVGVRVEPEPESLSLRGFPPPLHVWGRYLCLPGHYTVRAEREGYRPLREPIAVSLFHGEEFVFRLREVPGRVVLSLVPDVPYTVTVDDREPERDPQGALQIESGTHTIAVTTDRYLPERWEADVQGFGREQTLALMLRPAWADVEITSDPPGAEIRLDGDPVALTPAKVEVLQGNPEITLSLAAHKPVVLRPEVVAGEAMVLDTVALEPADGTLAITSDPSGALVTIDGVFYGETPLEQQLRSKLAHRIHLTKPGYRSAERTVTLEPEEARPLVVGLSVVFGTVFLSTQPPGAELFIDGKASGRATQRLSLPTRAHTLEIRKPGYETQRLRVTPDASAARNVNVALQTEEQARAARTPASITTSAGQVLRLVRPESSFTMGSTRREAGRRANESARLVAITRAYYLGEKEVTNGEFRAFKRSHTTAATDGASLNGDTQPVAGVSWEDAARYCNWLSQKEGLRAAYSESGATLAPVLPPTNGYRLPSEAEWAYAARFYRRSEPARYPWAGDYPPKQRAGNFADTRIADRLADVVPGYDDGYRGSSPVGSFAADAAGFHDLGGNVAEWTGDYYAVYPGEESTLVKDPTGPQTGAHRVIRGSGWRHGSITELRLSYRDYGRTARPDVGFRIARSAD